MRPFFSPVTIKMEGTESGSLIPICNYFLGSAG
jgi:hypothetical protein